MIFYIFFKEQPNAEQQNAASIEGANIKLF